MLCNDSRAHLCVPLIKGARERERERERDRDAVPCTTVRLQSGVVMEGGADARQCRAPCSDKPKGNDEANN